MAAIWPRVCPTRRPHIGLHSTGKPMLSFFCFTSCTPLDNLTYIFQKRSREVNQVIARGNKRQNRGLDVHAGFFWIELECFLLCHTLLKLLLVACWDLEKEDVFFCWYLRLTPGALELLLDSLHNCMSQLLLINSLSLPPRYLYRQTSESIDRYL